MESITSGIASKRDLKLQAITVIDGSDDDDVAWESDSCGEVDQGDETAADYNPTNTFDVEADVKLLSDLNDYEPLSPSGRTAAVNAKSSPAGKKGSSDMDRVVDTASRMADWAKHAVRRAFRDHAQTSTSQTPHSAATPTATAQTQQSVCAPPPLLLPYLQLHL